MERLVSSSSHSSPDCVLIASGKMGALLISQRGPMAKNYVRLFFIDLKMIIELIAKSILTKFQQQKNYESPISRKKRSNFFCLRAAFLKFMRKTFSKNFKKFQKNLQSNFETAKHGEYSWLVLEIVLFFCLMIFCLQNQNHHHLTRCCSALGHLQKDLKIQIN